MTTMAFNLAERTYLQGQLMGRLATVGPDGTPQARPLGFRLNLDDTVDLGGPWVASTQRWRNVYANPRVSFVVDDMTSEGPDAIAPGMGRGVEIRGRALPLSVDDPPGAPGMACPDVIRVHPERIVSWHIDPTMTDGRSVNIA